jgi:A/G-specific adenine glycosylase
MIVLLGWLDRDYTTPTGRRTPHILWKRQRRNPRILSRTPVWRREFGTQRLDRKRRLFIRRLLRWFGAHGRRYPWRETRDPYAILIAESMLQRTGAQQVLPVYGKFISRFPSLEPAAKADEDTLRTVLRPLGRVERYKIFHRALQYLARELKGRLPVTLESLRKVPGVGPYTARAVLVFAHRRRLGLFDPNIYRVVGRVFGLESTKPRPHTDPLMWSAVDGLIPKGRSREMNLALLDFAVAVCRRRKPLCNTCPLNDICDYYRRTKN